VTVVHQLLSPSKWALTVTDICSGDGTSICHDTILPQVAPFPCNLIWQWEQRLEVHKEDGDHGFMGWEKGSDKGLCVFQDNLLLDWVAESPDLIDYQEPVIVFPGWESKYLLGITKWKIMYLLPERRDWGPRLIGIELEIGADTSGHGGGTIQCGHMCISGQNIAGLYKYCTPTSILQEYW